MTIGTELRFAFYTAAFGFIWLMIEYLAGLHDRFIQYHGLVGLFALLIPVITYYVGLRSKRDQDYDGSFTFGQAFRSGMIMTAIATVLVVLLQPAFHYLINPSYFDNMITRSVEQAINNGRNPRDAYERAYAEFNLRSYMIMSGVATLILGTFLSLLFGYLLSRNRVPPHHPGAHAAGAGTAERISAP